MEDVVDVTPTAVTNGEGIRVQARHDRDPARGAHRGRAATRDAALPSTTVRDLQGKLKRPRREILPGRLGVREDRSAYDNAKPPIGSLK